MTTLNAATGLEAPVVMLLGMDPEGFIGQQITKDTFKDGSPIVVTHDMVMGVRYFRDTVFGIMEELGIPKVECMES